MPEELDQLFAPLHIKDIAIFIVVANVAGVDPSIAWDAGSSLCPRWERKIKNESRLSSSADAPSSLIKSRTHLRIIPIALEGRGSFEAELALLIRPEALTRCFIPDLFF